MRARRTNHSATPTTRPDASYSRIYLSAQYKGPRLLKNIRGRPSIPTVLTKIAATAAQHPEMGTPEDDDILRPPISSDEDELSPATLEDKSSSSSREKRKAAEIEDISSPKKRVKGVQKATRASKRSTANPNLEPEPAPAPSSSMPDFLESASQSSQSRRRMLQYGRNGSTARTSSQEAPFAGPIDLPSTPRKSQAPSFKVLEGTPKSRKRTVSSKLKEVDSTLPIVKPKENAILFKIPDDLGMPESSSVSTDPSNSFDNAESPKAMTRKRSSSTSSLSSDDSMASHALDQKQKDELTSDIVISEPLSRGSIRCPLCQQIVRLPKGSKRIDPHTLPLRKQQTFCHQHRVDEAQAEWRKNGFPTIDWDTLEKKRIPEYTSHLRQILYRKNASYYLTELESKLAEAKGNQSKIRKYLANDIVEIVKPGYYGPRGAKVMGNRITTELSNHLKRSLKADKTVRAVGVSGYISAVLLPELLQQLVMEDMNLPTDEEARRVISDSTEVGMLLWPDDDHVVRDDDDDDVNDKL